jgi:hypothetical protein
VEATCIVPYSDAVLTYCQGFDHALEPWPELPLSNDPEINWWEHLIKENHHGAHLLDHLKACLPQLSLPQVVGVSRSDLYRRTVLRGETLCSAEYAAIGDQPRWLQPECLSLWLAPHPCGAIPVLHTPCWSDFELLVRALAHRGEPAALATGVHAQAVSGLIHWDLIRSFGRDSRARLILLHEAPYGSVDALHVPGGLDDQNWLAASTTLRLEHELTHLATKRLVGQMRLNLFDELVADCMGMVAALGRFDAQLFARCLGIPESRKPIADGRWRCYTHELNHADLVVVVDLLLIRARELEGLLQEHKALLAAENSMKLLRLLTKQDLLRPFTLGQEEIYGV